MVLIVLADVSLRITEIDMSVTLIMDPYGSKKTPFLPFIGIGARGLLGANATGFHLSYV